MGISENHFCDMRKENVSEWLLEKTDGNGADVFFECVGKNETVAQAVDLTAPAGHVQLFDKNGAIKSIGENIMVICRYLHAETGTMCYTQYNLNEVFVDDLH